MNDLSRNPTLDDVAKRANVSTASVSRFINNPSVVTKKTAERIQQAINETGYIPNLLAGGLATNKSKLVAVLIPQLIPAVFTGTIEAMITELSASGSVVMLGITEFSTERADSLVMAALSRRAEAIIITGDVSERTREILKKTKTSVIEIWDLDDDPIDIAVGFSHHDIGKDIARFLKSKGYRRPHFVTTETRRAKTRLEAFRQEWREQGGKHLTEDALTLPLRFGQSRKAFKNVLKLPKRPDVLVCGADALALGLILEAQAAGLKVPDDIAIVGFGNSDLSAETRPSLTTIDIDGRRIAREAIALLNQRAKGVAIKSRRIDVGFKLIARKST